MPAAIDHDALFKLVLTAFFREFIDLVAPDLAAALDPEPPVFLDKERFADLFDPDRREADLVAQVRLRQRPATLLIHLEHQAQADAALDRRMFRYFARLYDRYDQPIYPIALCSYLRPRRPAADRHELRAAHHTVLMFQYQVVQLNRMDWRAYLTTTNPAAMALMARMRVAPEDRWRVKAACLRLLPLSRPYMRSLFLVTSRTRNVPCSIVHWRRNLTSVAFVVNVQQNAAPLSGTWWQVACSLLRTSTAA